jgi:hypothetical protein
MRLLASMTSILLVTACAVTPNQDEIGPFPSDYRDIVKNHLLRTLFDPYSVRSASISLPTQGHLLFRQGWIVCVELNAKNRMGGYVGLQRTAYLINRGSIAQSMEKAPLCDGNQLAYNKWPDIEQTR